MLSLLLMHSGDLVIVFNNRNINLRASNSVWNFTMSMIKVGLQDSNGNSLFSPISILTTINMLLLGTKGTTKEEIMQALGTTNSVTLIGILWPQAILATLLKFMLSFNKF